jgi:hypothetical protein
MRLWCWAVQTPLALFQKQAKITLWNTIKFVHMPLRLVPEILDAVNVILLVCIQL